MNSYTYNYSFARLKFFFTIILKSRRATDGANAELAESQVHANNKGAYP